MEMRGREIWGKEMKRRGKNERRKQRGDVGTEKGRAH